MGTYKTLTLVQFRHKQGALWKRNGQGSGNGRESNNNLCVIDKEDPPDINSNKREKKCSYAKWCDVWSEILARKWQISRTKRSIDNQEGFTVLIASFSLKTFCILVITLGLLHVFMSLSPKPRIPLGWSVPSLNAWYA